MNARCLPLLVLLWPALATADTPQQGFWERLEALCGQAFEGTLLIAPEGDDSFAGETLMMHVRDCDDTRIRIPFAVGDNRSRTWVLSRDDDAITLRHEHRHPDGSEEAVSGYGGRTPNPGSARVQMFPSDAQTWEVVNEAQTNVWMIEIDPGEQYIYSVHRLGTDRVFRVAFDLSEPVDPPPAPWGHED